MENLKHYTVNTAGNNVRKAEDAGYHAYYANGITAIEIMTKNKTEAMRIARKFGTVLYTFE